jgi:cbb3-type cytochrome oxidase subunit 3
VTCDTRVIDEARDSLEYTIYLNIFYIVVFYHFFQLKNKEKRKHQKKKKKRKEKDEILVLHTVDSWIAPLLETPDWNRVD